MNTALAVATNVCDWVGFPVPSSFEVFRSLKSNGRGGLRLPVTQVTRSGHRVGAGIALRCASSPNYHTKRVTEHFLTCALQVAMARPMWSYRAKLRGGVRCAN